MAKRIITRAALLLIFFMSSGLLLANEEDSTEKDEKKFIPEPKLVAKLYDELIEEYGYNKRQIETEYQISGLKMRRPIRIGMVYHMIFLTYYLMLCMD